MYDNSSVSYIKLIVAARKVETEVIVSQMSTTNKAGLLSINHSGYNQALTKQVNTLMSMVQGGHGKKGQTNNQEGTQQGCQHPNCCGWG